MNTFDSLVFELSPIPMWLEDFSKVKLQLDAWRAQGIEELADFLAHHPQCALECARKIKVIHVNTKTLELFEAENVAQIQQHLDYIFRAEVIPIHAQQLIQLWEGNLQFTGETLNNTLSGKRVDLKVRGHVLPNAVDDWSCVLLTTEDVTPYKEIAKREADHRMMAETLFQRSPAALLMQNFSAIKQRIDQIRQSGITDFSAYLDRHPQFVRECLNAIQVEDINQSALQLFNAPNKVELIQHFSTTLTHDQMLYTFHKQLIMLWNNVLTHQREATFVAFDQTIRYVYLQFTVFTGYENSWEKIQIALTDITTRKEAETYLAFLSHHDVLTNLYNRSFYTAELERLEHENPQIISCIYLDLNSLKPINDQFGHAAGDQLLKRTGDILKYALNNTAFTASRIGGDEFIVLMPKADQDILNHYVQGIQRYLETNQKQYPQQHLSFSIGATTRNENESIMDMLHRADQLMYEDKQAYYLTHDRREPINQLSFIES